MAASRIGRRESTVQSPLYPTSHRKKAASWSYWPLGCPSYSPLVELPPFFWFLASFGMPQVRARTWTQGRASALWLPGVVQECPAIRPGPRPKRQAPWTSLPLVSLLLSGLVLSHCPAFFLLSLGPSTVLPVVHVSLQEPFMCSCCLLFLDTVASCAGLQGAGDCTPTPYSFYSFNPRDRQPS